MLSDRIYSVSKRMGVELGLDMPYFIKNGFWVAFRQGVGVLTGLAISAAFARLASQEVFGQYQLVLSILSVVSILSIPGLNTAITQSVARGYDGDYKRAVKTSFLWSLLGTPVLLILGGYYYAYQSYPLGIALMVSSVFFPFLYAPNTWDAFLQGKSRFDLAAKYGSVQSVINAVATIAVVFISRENLVLITFIYLLSYTIFNWSYYLRTLQYIQNGDADGETLKFGWFLTKNGILGQISAHMDKVLIGTLLGPESLAIYAITLQVPIKMKEIFKVVISVLFPKLSKEKRDIKEIFSEKKKVLFLSFFLVALISAAFFLSIQPLNRIIFGTKYLGFYELSRYYSISVAITPFLVFLGYYVQAKKDYRAILSANTIYPLLQLAICAISISFFGLMGGVIAYNVNFVLYLLLYSYLVFISGKRG